MLKIKDNVDLKELEKFGFYTYYEEMYNDTSLVIRTDKTKRKGLLRREIRIPHHLGHKKRTLDMLYDLIQAGMVEKVEE